MMEKRAIKKRRKMVVKGRRVRHATSSKKMKIGTGAAAPLVRFFTPDGQVAVQYAATAFGMSRAKLAETVGIAPETLQRRARAVAPKTQSRLREAVEIINRVSGWAGGPVQAMAWYRAEPIPAFGGRTAESLVKEGKAAAVRDYLDGVALGGFA
jgi:hypothetical protein